MPNEFFSFRLRGVIVPIVDLRLKLACETAEYICWWLRFGSAPTTVDLPA